MCQRSTAGHHHAIEPLLFDLFDDVLDAVLRARIQIGLGVNHARQRLGVCGNLRHIEEARDIRSAVADKHADARLFLAYISFDWKFRARGQREARRAEARSSGGGGSARFHDRFRNVLRFAERPDGVDARSAGFQRIELHRVAEAVFVEFDPQAFAQRAHRFGNLHADGQHDEIKLFFDKACRPHRFLETCEVYRLIPNDQIVSLWIFMQLADAAARVVNAVPIARPFEVRPVAFAERTHIHHEDVHVQIGLMLFGDHRFLGRVHAAHRRAVIVRLIARADTLQEGNSLRRCAIRRTPYLPQRRAGRRQQPLELKRRDHVRIAPQAKFLRQRRLVDLITRR